MPIIITQVEKHDDDPGGLRTYEVRINRKVICRFQHRRKDGLAACLMEAAKAVSSEDSERLFYGTKGDSK